MLKIRARWAMGIAAAAAIGLLTGCAGGPATPTPSAEFVEGGTVTARMDSDWGNPIDGGQTSTSAPGAFLAQVTYATLVWWDPEELEYQPYIAESWEVEPDSVTLKIKDDVVCSDGTPVTADTVYQSFERYFSAELKARWPATVFGAGPYHIEKDDEENTFTLSMDRPNAKLLAGLADSRSGIICGAGLEPGADFSTASYGAGPFIFESARQGDEYVVVKNPDWTWGPRGWTSSDSGFPDRIVFKVIADNTTAANALLTGEVDITASLGPDVARLEADPGVEHRPTPASWPYMLMLNHDPNRPTSSEIVREAIITALDPGKWTQAAGEPEAAVSTNIQAAPGNYCYRDLSDLLPEPSIEDAQELLTDNGYELGADGLLTKDGQPVTLKVIGTDRTGPAVEQLGDNLRDVGFTVDLQALDHTTFGTKFGATDYDVTVGTFSGGDAATPSSTALFLVGKPVAEGGTNRLNRVDPEFQELADAAFGAGDEEEACDAWEDFNTYMLENWAARPWATQVSHEFTRAGEFSYIPSGGNVFVVMSLRRLG